MSGYISRSKLIKAVENLQDCYNGFSDTYDKACIIGLIAEQPSIEEPQKPKWIPVTERLPKENGFYLCLYKHKASGGVAMDEGLSILQWINNKWGINDIYFVTHWMPLPQPPKDGES